ncbi:MAG: acyl-ACP--UDP-N-acetylglucosamine O-acyltransferase [Labilithrix sp.]|nr:acyl-ACP--UDP-N-acetylglucosamine O-acyltransferase [Labilithrix sp.]MCW5812734.1 acyl-ACP--UDP-N-acetylglucosamine O-acyltransferase [Labilithrix sp.]
MSRIHPSSIVDRRAELADDVEVGPFCHVQAGVRIGAGTRLLGHVVVQGKTKIGARCTLHPFAVVGGEAQVKKGGEAGGGALEIGDDNVFRESVTVNVSSGAGATRIGAHNLFMAGCHVAHDAVIGSHCVIANAVQLAGHVVLDDWVTFGGLAGVAQLVRVGESAFVAAGAMCERDVPPFAIVQGDRARVRALNVVGLERRGVPADSIAALRRAFRALYTNRASSFESALASLDRSDPHVTTLARWLEAPERSVHPAKRLRPRG